MRKSLLLLVGVLLSVAGTMQAATITVTNSAGGGAGSLSNAIATLNDGDTIAFNIPGAGPHYITPPVGGFPLITKNNVTIDGYTQPGSSVNTSSILASNNAVIKIVLKGSDDGTDANRHFIDLTSIPITGFTDGEEALLAVVGAVNNFTVRGLCFLGNWADGLYGPGENPPLESPIFESQYAIALGGSDVAVGAHVSGCRFGLDPDNVTVGRLKDGVAAFGSGAQDTVIGVAQTTVNDAAASRAQFNIFIGMYISLIIEGPGTRVSGNFFNVYPDGLHDYSVTTDDGSLDHSMEAFIEYSRPDVQVIGTDGDGHNDAEERNIFGGVTLAGDRRVLEWYGTSPNDLLIAGNYFGLGVDGLTRFTNGGPGIELAETFKSAALVQFGSDFDGVSDAIEGNVISWNYPFSTLYPDPLNPALNSKWRFANFDIPPASAKSFRGNQFIGMQSPPFTYFPGALSSRLANYSNYVSAFMLPAGDYNTFVPTLSPTSSYKRLIGTCPPSDGVHDKIIIDVYLADAEGWESGKLFAFPELIVGGVTNGFAAGKTYLGSYLDNGPADSDPAVGSFNLNISALGLVPPNFVTVAANYSTDTIGTHRGQTFTSNFANPITLPGIVITSITRSGTTLTINWTGGVPPYTLQKKSPITGAWGNVTTGIAGTSTTDTITGSEGYYRIIE